MPALSRNCKDYNPSQIARLCAFSATFEAKGVGTKPQSTIIHPLVNTRQGGFVCVPQKPRFVRYLSVYG